MTKPKFEYPAYGPIKQTLTLDQAQLLGDVDAPPHTVLSFFTMDGQPVTRKRTYRQKVRSAWTFKALCNIEEVRAFFTAAEGEYIKYTHYDGIVWTIIVTGKTFPTFSDGLRVGSLETYTFKLNVDRWLYA